MFFIFFISNTDRSPLYLDLFGPLTVPSHLFLTADNDARPFLKEKNPSKRVIPIGYWEVFFYEKLLIRRCSNFLWLLKFVSLFRTHLESNQVFFEHQNTLK